MSVRRAKVWQMYTHPVDITILLERYKVVSYKVFTVYCKRPNATCNVLSCNVIISPFHFFKVSIWHNIFPQTKYGRQIGLNVTAYCLLRSPRVQSQVQNLGLQLGCRQLLVDAYNAATHNKPYSYLVHIILV